LSAYKKVVKAEVKVACMALRAAGKARDAKELKYGFKAWKCINNLDYGRSLRCRVDNAAALRAQLDPAEAADFTLVWDSSVMSWEAYMATSMAAGQRLLMHSHSPVKGVHHKFQFIADASTPYL